RRWALAYNTHDPAPLAPILADDVRVMSRWVVADMVGRQVYLDYLTTKFATFETVGSCVRVELAEAPGGAPGEVGRPCALLEQDGAVLATVLFDVIGGQLSQISLSDHPAPGDCLGTGEHPGFEDGAETAN
ncbi:MAG: hypothetical protein V2I67_02530, partial [Thermoanaerobaculales bacterium]|nr:hypothetical protein [Thermoanaerobaculales bacterium]